MNLTVMDACPACARTMLSLRACSQDCMRSSASDFVDATKHDDQPKLHLHVSCNECRFTWLAPVKDATKMARAW